MTSLSSDDIRAAVAAGLISEAQAVALTALGDTRREVRDRATALDEPFELFKGFNEIFIVVGLVILYMGWVGLTGLSLLGASQGYIRAFAFSLAALAAIYMLARYFTLKRRMSGPSNALTILWGISAVQLGLASAWAAGLNTIPSYTLAAAVASVLLAAHYWLFRVPFAMALIALGVYATIFGAVISGGTLPEQPQDIFLLSANGPFAAITIALGALGFAVAMGFDMTDPHRLTRRSVAGFWLHVVSAPAIVNTVALSLFQTGGLAAQSLLVAFIAAMAVLAVIIDRRSFLISGVGYIVALVLTVLEGQGSAAILALGLGLILLGAHWERMRGRLMTALPDFPGKTRLPPWNTVTEKADD